MSVVVLRLNVPDVDPTRVDPHDIADYLMDIYETEVRAGNGYIALSMLDAEWE